MCEPIDIVAAARLNLLSMQLKAAHNTFLTTGSIKTYVTFATIWQKGNLSDYDELELFSRLMLEALLNEVKSEVLAREVMPVLGTKLCPCDQSLQWRVAYTYLAEGDYMLSVRLEAFKALYRLHSVSPEIGAAVTSDWEAKTKELAGQYPRVPEIQERISTRRVSAK